MYTISRSHFSLYPNKLLSAIHVKSLCVKRPRGGSWTTTSKPNNICLFISKHMEDFESHVYLQLVLGCSDSITSSLWSNKTWHYILTKCLQQVCLGHYNRCHKYDMKTHWTPCCTHYYKVKFQEIGFGATTFQLCFNNMPLLQYNGYSTYKIWNMQKFRHNLRLKKLVTWLSK